MKKSFFIIIPIIAVLLLSACSSKSKENGLEITEDNRSYVKEFEQELQDSLSKMNENLNVFNDALDNIYKRDITEEDFATILKQLIDKSSQLIAEAESYDTKPELFEAQQNLVLLLNKSHQLLLDAIEMANNQDIDKELLREDYLAIKEEQASLANQWKTLKEELSTDQGEK
ncbi:hypothetical protein [Parageobacillus thermoglucosidasius]|jgi:WD40 repeat protein|uniref:hypothetical protein n=1 Tax=Parageobacillus thermoglucosidasius TaxID=1426 RepID=UPI000B569F94|nr:hypothetical protein [Parageobacillus thermoglucosidasius]OUM91092.1 MAG: hypothetical protein BAA00_16550 [Parageobacillus thermoglucosidasius]